MVPCLKFYSHPDKPLEEHIRGVMGLTAQRSSLPYAYWAALFHDIGKINPNFQEKLKGNNAGYSNHSHLSLLAFTNFAFANSDTFKKSCKIQSNEEFALYVFLVSLIIGKHHGNLPDLEKVSSKSDEIKTALSFFENNLDRLPAKEFIEKKLNLNFNDFTFSFDKKSEIILTYTTKHHEKVWRENPLRYFMDTQEAFAALIESDKRDASENKDLFFKAAIDDSAFSLCNSLSLVFESFENSQKISSLNKLRTEIRLEAVDGVNNALSRNERVFTLTAPTGAGKTYTLLAIAKQIRKSKGNLGIVYALPFLSITEQVEGIVKDLIKEVLSVNSKAENERIEKAQLLYEGEPSPENLSLILKEDFTQNTFDHPFIITTFVQLFETLISNRNSTLLKLPNFANRIFLIDEVQALPPRLYIFFTAWLDAFCKRNNSYAVLSTATMPKMAIPVKLDARDDERADLLFKYYAPPKELIDAPKFFREDVFNRYKIDILDEKISIDELKNHVLKQELSCLVILNTIADTKQLFEKLKEKVDCLYLLNTHFIPDDRSRIIGEVKDKLNRNQRVILISTQLIEAGVDIDFPIVYRDLCPLPSLIQSAGRCNRNKSIALGQVYFFNLVSENGRSRAILIYRNEAKTFLDFCVKELRDGTSEKELFEVQSKFFEHIKENLSIGDFVYYEYKNELKGNMVECVNRARFDTLGKFKLINEDIGEQIQFYILKDENDCIYNELEYLTKQLSKAKTFPERQKLKIDLYTLVKSLNGRIINVRLNRYNRSQYPTEPYIADIMGIRFIGSENYSPSEGLRVNNIDNCIL